MPNKRNARAGLFLSAGVLVLALAVYYGLVALWIKPETIPSALVKILDRNFDTSLTFKTASFNAFPVPSSELGELRITFRKTGQTLTAKRARIFLGVLHLLIGRAEVVRVHIQGGSSEIVPPERIPLAPVRISNMNVRIQRSGDKARYQWTADAFGREQAFKGEGWLLAGKESLASPAFAGFEAGFSLEGIDLLSVFKPQDLNAPMRLQAGSGRMTWKIHRVAGQPWVQLESKAEVKGLVYEIYQEASRVTSPTVEAFLEADFTWHPAQGEVVLKRSLLSLPAGRFEASGRTSLATGELKDVRFSGTDILLESLPQYYIPFQEAVPFNFGFSGRSSFEMSAEGSWKELALHANWDLTPALISYGGYFSKHKDFPLHLLFDFSVKQGRMLEGDFSLELEKATTKGTLRSFNLRTGEGELNLLTNKFSIDGWEALIPAFKDYKLGGEVKILANLSGNLIEHPGRIKRTVNVTVQNGRLRDAGGHEIRNIHFSLDSGLLALELKEAEFQIGASPVLLALHIEDPFGKPSAKLKLAASQLHPVLVLETARELAGPWFPESLRSKFLEWEKTLESLLPAGQFLEKTALEAEYAEERWSFPRAVFEVYEGSVTASGTLEMRGASPAGYELDCQIDRINLARFLKNRTGFENPAEGNFFFVARLRGEGFDSDWKKRLRGQGTFSLTNGRFKSFDVLAAVAKIEGFEDVGNSVSGETGFDDVRSSFSIEEGRMKMDKLSLVSRDFSMVASGELSLEGILNYRLNVFLSGPVATRLFEAHGQKPSEISSEPFGPLELLLAGDFGHPEIQPDPAFLPRLKDQLLKRKDQEVLNSFLPEDFFFKRPANS